MRTRSRPFFSHSCTVSIFSSTCFIRPGPLRLAHCERALGVCQKQRHCLCTAILVKVVLLPRIRLFLSRSRTGSASGAPKSSRLLRACPRKHCASVKENCSFTAALTSLPVVSPLAVDRHLQMCLHVGRESVLGARHLYQASCG